MTAADLKSLSAAISLERSITGPITIGTIYQLVEQPKLYVGVPPMPNHFVGREALIEQLVRNLLSDQHAAISAFEGLPGVGKTTLAVALAHHKEILKHYEDGVLWASLGLQPDVMGVLARWARALDLEVSDMVTAEERARAVQDAIAQRHLLLVVDDAWDMESAQILRCGGPHCGYVLTTRNQAIARDCVGANHINNVPVLEKHPAAQFLQLLAPEAFNSDSDTCLELISAVGELPLAIELLGGYLAAPEHRVFPELSREALKGMGESHRRLQLAKQRLGASNSELVSLHRTIALSLEELPPNMVETFYALGAFAPKPEQFQQTAAKAVGCTGAQTLALLIARNLLQQHSDTWLTLHQVLADVARSATPLEAIERHRNYYLALINEDREDWQQIENLYGQIKWMWKNAFDDGALFSLQEAIDTFQDRRGLWEDKAKWLTRLLHVTEIQGDRGTESQIRSQVGAIYARQGRWEQAFQIYQESLSLFRQLGDVLGEAQTLNKMGNVHARQGRWDKAQQIYQESLSLFRQLDDILGEAQALNNLGIIYCEQEQWAEALHMYQESLAKKRKTGDTFGEALTLMNIGIVYRDQKQWEKALQMYQESLTLFRQIGDVHGESLVLHNLGRVYDCQSRWKEAIQMYEMDLDICIKLNDDHGEGTTLGHLGQVYYKQGEKKRGVATCQEALAKMRRSSPEYQELSEWLQNHDDDD